MESGLLRSEVSKLLWGGSVRAEDACVHASVPRAVSLARIWGALNHLEKQEGRPPTLGVSASIQNNVILH